MRAKAAWPCVLKTSFQEGKAYASAHIIRGQNTPGGCQGRGSVVQGIWRWLQTERQPEGSSQGGVCVPSVRGVTRRHRLTHGDPAFM